MSDMNCPRCRETLTGLRDSHLGLGGWTCKRVTGKENMKYYDSFDTLPGKKGYGVVFFKDKEENIKKFKNINWSEVAFLSTNSAYNIRSSQITDKFIE